MIALIILAVVFLLIAIRQTLGIKLAIWQIMLGGALAAILSGQIAIHQAVLSINLDVMVFLFAMFFIGQVLEESGYLSHISYNLFKRAKNLDHLLLLILFGAGIASAFLMNDTLAIIGTPVVILLAKQHNVPSKMLLFALAFAITIGSVMSPIGNPQNLLIAINGGLANPFIAFLQYLFLPSVICLFAAYIVLKLFYKSEFKKKQLTHVQEPIKDKELAALSKISLFAIFGLILLKILFSLLQINLDFKLTYIALLAMLPLLLSRNRLTILKKMDWHTLVFFAAMFILMESVWETGFFQARLSAFDTGISIPLILLISILVSQFISNVPLVALYLPLLLTSGASTKELLALAAGSTIAGNLLILGAASNVIIIQNAEKKGATITFLEFAKVGVPLTIICAIVYFVFLVILWA